MAQEAIARALGAVPFLRGLGAAERATVAGRAEIRDYPEGATIVAQDDAGRTLYVILAGRVRVVRHAEEAAIPLAEFGPGEFFGEMGVLEKAQRNATVISKTPMTLFTLSHWDVKRLQREAPEAVDELRRVIDERRGATQ